MDHFQDRVEVVLVAEHIQLLLREVLVVAIQGGIIEDILLDITLDRVWLCRLELVLSTGEFISPSLIQPYMTASHLLLMIIPSCLSLTLPLNYILQPQPLL